MEIEAKFAIPDVSTFQRLLALETLAGLRLTPGPTREVHDRSLDTLNRSILRAGYACRVRQRENQRLVTFKGLGGAEGAIHQRAEHEVLLPPGATEDPTTWPAGLARTLAMELSQGQPLRLLFDLRQTRHVRAVTDGDQAVAELSLDEVHAGENAYFELEVELTLAGTMDDLRRLADELATHWKLAPEPRSKFERALTLHPSPS
jgi:inorganic triphosphatase YgiF